MTFLLVAAGAAVGAPLRYVAAHLLDSRLHWGTILVNVVGSFLLGLFSGLALSGSAVALLGTGFCGALTTFSAFAVHVHDLGPRKGAATVALTVVPALALTFLGFWLGAR
ncbi:MAG TPA: CrcB family protein [Nocardioidaceae bacterium]